MSLRFILLQGKTSYMYIQLMFSVENFGNVIWFIMPFQVDMSFMITLSISTAAHMHYDMHLYAYVCIYVHMNALKFMPCHSIAG
jgi:hypothetical protein